MTARRQIATMLVLFTTAALRADVITGNISNWIEGTQPMQIGDGQNHVTFYWTITVFGSSGRFYGSDFEIDSDVALAASITDVTQITNAASFSFETFFVGPASDAEHDNGVGDFVIAHNVNTGHYGVLRIDDIAFDELNATWWFQTDGSGDFSAQPPACDGFTPCDANCDGSVNLFDIPTFVATIQSQTGCSPCAGDTNDDGSINLFDIDPFVACLSG